MRENFHILRILHRLSALTFFERWISSATIKKVNKCLRQIQYGRLEALRIALFKPFMLGLPNGNLLLHRQGRYTFPSLFVGLGHCSQRLIPDPANTAKGPGQMTLLHGIWIDSDFDRFDHNDFYSIELLYLSSIRQHIA
jgi:hypothetical protein